MILERFTCCVRLVDQARTLRIHQSDFHALQGTPLRPLSELQEGKDTPIFRR